MSKKWYRVDVREVHIQPYYIQAGSKPEAAELVADGDGQMDESAFFYSDTLDTDTWQVADVHVEKLPYYILRE